MKIAPNMADWIAIRLYLINDLDAVQQQLEQQDIFYTLSKSGRRALFCRDPDGNAVELIQDLSVIN